MILVALPLATLASASRLRMQHRKEYADFSELGSFARLDQLMNTVRRKFPEDSERFYRIQNRQQLLARDILRNKYGITIPEPQLTGTSWSLLKSAGVYL